MDDADMIRIARGIEELDEPKFTGHKMTELPEVQQTIRERLGELATKARTNTVKLFTADEPMNVGAALRAYFLTDEPEEPSEAIRAARRKVARALVKAAKKFDPEELIS